MTTSDMELSMLSPVLSAMREALRDENRSKACAFCGESGYEKADLAPDGSNYTYLCANNERCVERARVTHEP